MRTNSDDTFLLQLAEVTAGGDAGLRALISQQLAFAQSHVVELPAPEPLAPAPQSRSAE